MLHQQCHSTNVAITACAVSFIIAALVGTVVHHCTVRKKCDCQKFYSLTIACKQQQQQRSVWWQSWHCWPVSEHWTKGEWPCAAVTFKNQIRVQQYWLRFWWDNFVSSYYWSREHGHPAAIHSRRVWGHVPAGNFGDFRCSEVHSGAFWGIQRNTKSFLRRDSSS